MKKTIYFLSLVITSAVLISNSAQPGVWNAGGSGSFTLLYPEDTIAYKKIQMKSENIYMQLYKGFAGVKGDYFYKNTTKDTLKIKVGYPINTVFENIDYHPEVNEVRVDGLYKIKGLVNDAEATLYKKPNANNDNWYVWEVTFPPNKITKFTVYFLVNTNNAKILEGYESDDKNAFIYLIETGSIWKSPIEKGNFYAQLKDNISIDNIKTSSPSDLFYNNDESILKFTMTDYGKKPDPNFIITYGNTLNDFDFEEITQNSSTYFSNLDEFAKTNFTNTTFINKQFPNAYKVGEINTKKEGIQKFMGKNGLIIASILLLIFFIGLLYNKLFKK